MTRNALLYLFSMSCGLCVEAKAGILNFTGFELAGATEYSGSYMGSGSSTTPTAARSGAYGFNCTQADGTATDCQIEVRGPGRNAIAFADGRGVTALYTRFSFRFANAPETPAIFLTVRRLGAANNSTLRLNPSRTISIYDSSNVLALTGTTSLDTNTWHTIEYYIQANDATANTTVRIDGAEEPHLTQQSGSVNAGPSNIALIYLGKASTADIGPVRWDYDDLVLSDTGFPPGGDVHVAVLMPSGAGSYAGWGNPGPGNIADNPDSGLSTVSSTANPDTVTFAISDWSSLDINGGASIYAVRPYIRIANGSGETDGEVYIRSGSTDTSVPLDDAQITGSLHYFGAVYETDPAHGGAWTPIGINGTEVGVRVTSPFTMKLSNVSLHVLYATSPRRKCQVVIQ